MVTSRLGIPLTLMWLSQDSMVIVDTAEAWGMDSEEIDWFSITAGANYHFLKPESKFDLWGGPFLGLVSFDDARYTIFGETEKVKFDDDFVWGLQLGFDIPARKGVAFYGGLRWFSLELEVEGFEELDFNLDPLVLNAGISYRF